ncbi:MAG: undecaprenyl/decaprenyl-phosphate alpha-N-acetylglucosaminyl 1-phosphate transferase [Phycisphaerales bacterium]|nr:MAG: undecaprenyl/decaprenyl-phosphate alpha-N-acetylglucosaminyl 1-phosphate transferase [Phycisphaerales bacterium]
MKTYLVVYFGSAVLAVLITPLLIWLDGRLGLANDPHHRHVHERPVPRIGGVAIFLSMIALTIPVLFLSNTVGEAFREILGKLIVLLCAAGFILFVGLIDDLKAHGLGARLKFAAQLTAALAVCAAGIRIQSVTVADSLTLDFGWFPWPLTLLWIVGITNAVNLSDGLDGLAAGISAVACGVIAIFAVHSGNVVMAVLMLALLGSLTGFLFFNFNPAKIFMGDCGSMFLGFTLASSSVLCLIKSSVLVGLALPILALGIPICDTLFSMIRRFLERRSMFAPDRSHFHHRLVDLGLKHHHVVIIIYVITLLAAGMGLFMMFSHNGRSLMVFFSALLLLIFVFRFLGGVQLKEMIAGLQRKYAIRQREHAETKNFEDAELHFRRAQTFEQWWKAISVAAEKMDFLSLRLPVKHRDGTQRTLTWRQKAGSHDSQDGLLQANIPVRDRRSGSSLNLKIEVFKNGSLESAGRRIALFTRLMEEHDIANLVRKKKD